jgi:hypothetical protein
MSGAPTITSAFLYSLRKCQCNLHYLLRGNEADVCSQSADAEACYPVAYFCRDFDMIILVFLQAWLELSGG